VGHLRWHFGTTVAEVLRWWLGEAGAGTCTSGGQLGYLRWPRWHFGTTVAQVLRWWLSEAGAGTCTSGGQLGYLRWPRWHFGTTVAQVLKWWLSEAGAGRCTSGGSGEAPVGGQVSRWGNSGGLSCSVGHL